MHFAGGFTFITRLCKPCLQDWLLFTLLVFCMDGAFVASSGTWKATGVERSLIIKQPFNHSLNCCSFFLGTTRQGLGCPWQTPAAHALFGISIDSLHWAAGGLVRRDLSRKSHLFLGCGRKDGRVNYQPPSQLPPGSHWLHHLWKWVST